MTTQLEKFCAEYRHQLEVAVRDHPKDYKFMGSFTVDQVADKMVEAFKAGTYNKDGRAIKATCKTLGIKHTYRDINAYFANMGITTPEL